MVDAKMIEKALIKATTPEFHSFASELSEILEGYINSTSDESRKSTITTPEHYANLLKQLAGREIRLPDAVVSFGKDNSFGNVFVRDIAGKDINHFYLFFSGINKSNDEKYERLAARQLAVYIRRHFYIFMNIYKASMPSKLERRVSEPRELFDEDYYANVIFFDFSGLAPVLPATSWFNYLQREFAKFNNALEGTIQKYGSLISFEVVELGESLINAHLTSLISQLPSLPQIDAQHNITRPYILFFGSDMTNMLRTYITDFLRLIDWCNSNAPEDQKIQVFEDLWRDDVAPTIGSARTEISSYILHD